MNSSTPDFKRCVVLLNPVGTNHKRAKQLIRKLERRFAEVKVVETAKTSAQTSKLIADLAADFDEHTLLCVGGGDGTVNLVVNSLFNTPGISAKAKQVTILPLWGGNANDLAYMINGSSYRISLYGILEHGRVVPIYPLAVSMKRERTTKTKLGVCYVSFGASAFIAEYLRQPKFQQRKGFSLPGVRLITEAWGAMWAIAKATPFKVQIEDDTSSLYDLILINGSRIAKVYRAPNRLTEQTFFELSVNHKHPFFLFYLGKVLHSLALERSGKKHRSLTLHEPAWMQLDGEVEKVAAHTDITVTIHDEPIHVLSTKL